MKKQILFGLLAAGMLAACSSDDSLSENQANEYDMVAGQPAYLSLGIAMPNDPQTRANDDFDDGAEDEYKVHSGMLYLFKGSSEADAVIFGAYEIPTSITFGLDGSDQITSTSSQYVQEISSPDLASGQKLFAYVMLNNKGNVTGLTYTLGTTTWADFSKEALTAIGLASAAAEEAGQGAMSTTNGLVMTNAPLSTEAGGTAASTGDIKTLAEIDKSSIYKSKKEAEDATNQTCIYVERAAVKVQVNFTSTVKSPNATAATLEGWELGNVNYGGTSGTGYYNVRQVETAWSAYNNQFSSVPSTTKYRFVCANALTSATGHAVRFRTYFGKDVNYTSAALATKALKNTKTTAYPYAKNGVAYTYENTFDENSQLYGNTTFVGLKVKLNGGADFYTIGADNETMYSESDAKTSIGNSALADATTEISTIKSTIESKIAAALSNPSSELCATAGCASSDNISFKLAAVVNWGTLNTTTNEYDAYTVSLKLSDVTVTGTGTPALVETAIGNLEYATSTKVSDKLATALTITRKTVKFYDDGVTYYAVRIAHFGDVETPWSAPSSAYDNYDLIYPTSGTSSHKAVADQVKYGDSRANAWLGRWGIVRNNWYDIEVNSISAVGSAVPVDFSGTATGTPGGTPDDNPEVFYISAHIHILPWVKRVQNQVLK
ncbi:MAG: Mfa1 fimbrilin C-terminal domain-containing protein [Prevotellaceae bacterium]|nr:Mfa1 fimbrilin C-terminal domain-containing protein [Candidatus Colivivens caballi]